MQLHCFFPCTETPKNKLLYYTGEFWSRVRPILALHILLLAFTRFPSRRFLNPSLETQLDYAAYFQDTFLPSLTRVPCRVLKKLFIHQIHNRQAKTFVVTYIR